MSNQNEPPALTRRAVLRGAAAAGAASLVAPGSGLAAALGREPPYFSKAVGTLNGVSGTIPAPAQFALVGVEWVAASPKAAAATATAQIELRSRTADGRWSAWANASVLGHGPDRPVNREELYGEPIWTGPARFVQLRSAHLVRGVQLHFVGTSGGGSGAAVARSAHAASGLPLASPVLDAGPGQPPIIARAGWARGHAAPSVRPSYGTIKLAFVHHTDTPNGYSAAEVPAMLRSIYVYHRFVRGFHDIAYNFAIDDFGRIWEARAGGIDEAVVGAQAGGYNEVSTGVAVLGTFMDIVPSPAAIKALEHLLAWKLALHGIPASGKVTVEVDPADYFYTPFGPGAHVSLPRVAGHRQGDLTVCPGNAFFARLPSIRPHIVSLQGRPARVTITAGRPLSGSVRLAGRLRLLTGQALGGAPIEVQQLRSTGAKTIATTTTAADGSWSAQLPLKRGSLVRALHRPAPASASKLLEIGKRR